MDDIQKLKLAVAQIKIPMETSKLLAEKATNASNVAHHETYAAGIGYALYVLHLWFPDDIATPYGTEQTPNLKLKTSN
jgi:hypothetical protein